MPRYIDADYLLGTYQALCSAISCEECRAKYKDGTCKVEHWLKAQPTIEERKKGKWLHEQLALPLSDGSKECVRCSCCLTHWDNESNYCPNCGADMREEKPDETVTR